MRLVFGAMRLSPAEFWRLTPRELAAMAKALGGAMPAPMDRAALDEMMERFPDRRRNG